MQIETFDSLMMTIKESQMFTNQVGMELTYCNRNGVATLTPNGEEVVIHFASDNEMVFISKLDHFPPIEINSITH